MSSPCYSGWETRLPTPLVTLTSHPRSLFPSFTLGKSECAGEVMGLEVKDLPAPQPGPYSSYGTFGDSLNLMTEAWHELDHVFSIHSDHALTSSPKLRGRHHYLGPRPPLNVLARHQVDLLVVECGRWQCPRPPLDGHRWELMIQATPRPSRPRSIIEVWPPNSLLWELGPAGKAARVRWETLGYSSKMKVIDPQHCGGAIVQPRALVVRHRSTCEWSWAEYSSLSPARPMQNLLTPKGLRPRRKQREPPTSALPVFDIHPMPGKPGAWIRDGDGPRQLFPVETAKALGAPKLLLASPDALSPKLLGNSTSVFHFEYLSQCFLLQLKDPTSSSPQPEVEVHDALSSPPSPPPYDFPEWRPPDLSPGGVWHTTRVQRLKTACSHYVDSDRLFAEGLVLLENHRKNYDSMGPAPTKLQLLWWEFPQSCWEDIRLGGSMNFLTEPKHQIIPNSPMNADELKVAEEFVDELIALGVLRPALDESGRPVDVVTNAPLFTVPKPGQPGQYRCIADMLKGGQNESVGSDPVVLPRASHIIDEMYHGGYSAVYDFSKYFYNFPTRAEDRPFLGCLHPVTSEMLAYYGLPMGGGNSPGVACRGGEAFLRLIRESHHLFRGTPSANCWWTGFQRDGGYDPRLGYGYNLTNREGLVVKVWGFVDDFIKHAQDQTLIHQARMFFLDVACNLGFLCHPTKCPTPSQQVKFIGFEFDTRLFPTLRIPLAKRERSLAVVEYLLATPSHQTFSRLSLAVATGILQSLVDGTPNRIGSTYLRSLYDVLHPPGAPPGLAAYCTKTPLSSDARKELRWWEFFLQSTRGRPSRMLRSATLVPNWGDGSGTGTGGTLGVPDQPLQMWQGQWSPVVYKFSSNWKELKTLHLTLLQIKAAHADTVRSTTVFYFTDNSTTYWICQAGRSSVSALHSLVTDIKLLELELGCQLQVVHVPGVVMIVQGSDALSRGVWITPFQETMDQCTLTAAVFAPLAPDRALVDYCIGLYNLPVDYIVQPWDSEWLASPLLDKMSVWFPPPELARQSIAFMLAAWVQRPRTTSALFFVPRIVPAFWFGLSRHIKELQMLHPRDFPLQLQPVLPIPIIVLYLAPHIPSIPSKHSRMVPSSTVRGARWHRQQAELLRGLPSVTIPESVHPEMPFFPPGF